MIQFYCVFCIVESKTANIDRFFRPRPRRRTRKRINKKIEDEEEYENEYD